MFAMSYHALLDRASTGIGCLALGGKAPRGSSRGRARSGCRSHDADDRLFPAVPACEDLPPPRKAPALKEDRAQSPQRAGKAAVSSGKIQQDRMPRSAFGTGIFRIGHGMPPLMPQRGLYACGSDGLSSSCASSPKLRTQASSSGLLRVVIVSTAPPSGAVSMVWVSAQIRSRT